VSTKLQSRSAYGFLAPALLVLTLCGVLPMAFVAYYSVHDTFEGNSFIWVGMDWYRKVLTSPEFFAATGSLVIVSCFLVSSRFA
jgi:ABC-type sugar transport system permease subunit